MKQFRLFAALIAASLFISCGGGSGSSSSGGSVDNKQDASNIIEYYNTAIGMFRNAPNADKYQDVIKYMEANGRSITSPLLIAPTAFRDSAKLINPGTYFSKEQRDTLQMAFREFVQGHKDFVKNYDTFKEYKKAEDYKDDNWAKGKQLAQENADIFARMQSAKEAVYGIIVPLADDAEMLLMDDNPLKAHIMHAKQIFASMDELMDEAAAEKVNMEAIDASYTKLEGQVQAGREIPAVADMDREMRYYSEYLDQVEKFMGIVRKARRNSRFTDSVYRDMQSEYRSVVGDYNSFVD